MLYLDSNLAVVHYGFRHDTAQSPSLDTDVWALHSSDGGATRTEERVTPTSFDMRLAPFARGCFVGDYIGMAAAGTAFKPFFSASFTGTDAFATTFSEPFAGLPVTPEPAPAGL